MNNINNYPFLGTNSLLSSVLKTLIDCSNNFKITIYSDASGINFATDTSGNKIYDKFVCCEIYIPDEYINITFNDGNYIKLRETDKYWYTICANRDMLEYFDLSYCLPTTLINSFTFGNEVNKFLNVNQDVSANSFDYRFDYNSSYFSNINHKNINIYADSLGIIHAKDNYNFPTKNRFLKNITYRDKFLTVEFGNNSIFTINDYDDNNYWYNACVFSRKKNETNNDNALMQPHHFIQYPDNENLSALLNNLLRFDIKIFFFACNDPSGNNYVNDNNENFVDNRIVINSFYTPLHVNESTGETFNGYTTITFGNDATLNVVDDINSYYYNIKIK